MKKLNGKITFFLFIFLISGALMAQSLERQYQEADAELNRVYKELRSHLTEQKKAELKKSQLDWIKKRDAFVAANPENPRAALYQATKQRLGELARILAQEPQSLKENGVSIISAQTSEQLTATRQQCQQADSQLNQVYQQLRGTLNGVQKQELQIAQRDWLKKRDAFVAANPTNPNSALYQVTMQRILELRGFMETTSPLQKNGMQNPVNNQNQCVDLNALNQQLKEVYDKLYKILELRGKDRLEKSQNKWLERKQECLAKIGNNNINLLIKPTETRIKLLNNNIVALQNGTLKSPDILNEETEVDNLDEETKSLANNRIDYLLSKINRFARIDIASQITMYAADAKLKRESRVQEYRKHNIEHFLSNTIVGILEGGYTDINSSYAAEANSEIENLESILQIILSNQQNDTEKSRRVKAVFQEKNWDEKNLIADCLGKKYRIFSTPGSNRVFIFDAKTKLMYGAIENAQGSDTTCDPATNLALCDNETVIYSQKRSFKGSAFQFNYITDLSYIYGEDCYRIFVSGPYQDENGNIGVKMDGPDESNHESSSCKVTKESAPSADDEINRWLAFPSVTRPHLIESLSFAQKHQEKFNKIGFNFYFPNANLFSSIEPKWIDAGKNIKLCQEGVASANSNLANTNTFHQSTEAKSQVISAQISGDVLDLKIMNNKPTDGKFPSNEYRTEDLAEFKSIHINLHNVTLKSNYIELTDIFFNPKTILEPRPNNLPSSLDHSTQECILSNYHLLFDGLELRIADNQNNNKSFIVPQLFQMAYFYNRPEHIVVGYSISPNKYESDYYIRIHNYTKNKDIYYSSNNRKHRSFSQTPSHYYDETSGELWLSDDSSIFSIDTDSGAVLKSVDVGKKLEVFAVSEDKFFGMPRMDERLGEIWKRNPLKKICDVVWDETGNVMLIGKDGFYATSGKSIHDIAARSSGQVHPFEQFDLSLNRPDIVLAELGAESEKVAFLKNAYQRRLKRMGVTEEMLQPDFHLPEIEIVGDLPSSTAASDLVLKIKASDSKYPLDRLRLYVNNVPVNGKEGELLRDAKSQTLERTIPIKLAAGRNKIQVSVLNSAGAESLYANAEVTCTAQRPKPTLYAVAMGVSEYSNPEWNLKYAAKDATDVLARIRSKSGSSYGEVKELLLTDRDATKESLGKIREFLSKATVDDTVLMFVAGHGLLDSKYDYYFGTSDIDFDNPSGKGIAFEEFDDLLGDLPCLKKSLLIDTCHAGELDEDEKRILASAGTSAPLPAGQGIAVRSVGTRGMTIKPIEGARGKSEWYDRLQGLFVDLRRGSGSTILSSSAGAEYALESSEQKNGLFTYAVLEALDGKEGSDANKDGSVTMSELADYVKTRVAALTNNKQSPNVRRVNLESDFTVASKSPLEPTFSKPSIGNFIK